MSQYNDTGYYTLKGSTVDHVQHARVTAAGAVADASTLDIGVATRAVTGASASAPKDVAIALLSKQGTHKAIAAGAFAVGATLYCAASGKVDDSGTVVRGMALQAATADGDIVEVLPFTT